MTYTDRIKQKEYIKKYSEKKKKYLSEYNREYKEKNQAYIIEYRDKRKKLTKIQTFLTKLGIKEYNSITQVNNKNYWENNKKWINKKRNIQGAEDTKNFKLIIGNKSRVEKLECMNSNCNFNYEVWKKRNVNRPYIECLTFEHINSFFVVSQSFDKEAMNNHPIYHYKARFLSQKHSLIFKKLQLSDEYLREYISLSCEQCQRDNFYQDILDLEKNAN